MSFGKMVLAVALGNILSWVLVVGMFMGLWTVGYVQSELREALQRTETPDQPVTVRTFDELDYREPEGRELRELDPHLADRGCGDYAVSPQGRGTYAVKCGDSYLMVFTIMGKVMGPYEGGSRAN